MDAGMRTAKNCKKSQLGLALCSQRPPFFGRTVTMSSSLPGLVGFVCIWLVVSIYLEKNIRKKSNWIISLGKVKNHKMFETTTIAIPLRYRLESWFVIAFGHVKKNDWQKKHFDRRVGAQRGPNWNMNTHNKSSLQQKGFTASYKNWAWNLKP